MNKAIKIGKVLTRLQHLKGDIIFLQETHLKTSDTLCIKRAWMGHYFHSRSSSRARGAAIIIHKSVMFVPTNTILDNNGRYVIVSGVLQGMPVILVSVYAPNWDDDQFFMNLFAKLPNADNHRIIMGGDFNLIQDVHLAEMEYSSPGLGLESDLSADFRDS